MDLSFCLIGLIAVAVLVAVVLVTYRQQQKRTKDMRAVAEQLGYRYVQEEGEFDTGDSGLPLFSHGHTRKARNMLRTELDGVEATVMDYRYESGYGRNRRTETQTVLLFESNRLKLPAFGLRPERAWQKVAGFLGQQDIDFEGQPAFSESYVLQGADEGQVRALFDAEKLVFFAERPGLCVEGHGPRLLFYQARRIIAPAAIPAFIAEGQEVLRLMAGAAQPAPAPGPEALAGLDEVLADLGVEDGAPAAQA